MIIFIFERQKITQNDPSEYIDKTVLKEFAKRLGVTTEIILEHNKRTDVAEYRHLYCKLRREMHDEKFSIIARELDRSHTAVRRGFDKINDLFYMGDEVTLERWNKVKDISCIPTIYDD